MRWFVALPIMFTTGLAWGQTPRGLILRIQAGKAIDARVEGSVALFCPEGQAPTPFLSPGPFKASWRGKLVLPKRSRLVFTLEGSGKARLLVDGEVLVDGIGKSNESKRLSSGEHEFVCEYESPAEGNAQLRLFWAGRDFGREPVPATAFVHDQPGGDIAKRLQLRDGRKLLAEKRCTACHDAGVEGKMPELLLDPPSLERAGERLRREWLAKWIANPSAVRPSAHMPRVLGNDGAQQAADIAAYLVEGSKAPGEVVAPDADAVRAGGHLFQEQGCIACHTLDAKGDAERIGLGEVTRKFHPGAVAAFLQEPAKFHRATRMPEFGFDLAEARALEAYLCSLSKDPPVAVPDGNSARGKDLFTKVGCAHCHQHGEKAPPLSKAPPLAKLNGAECTAVRYSFGDAGRDALALMIATREAHASLGRAVPAEFAHRSYESLRCNACHSRRRSEPLRENYAAEVGHLKRPEPADAEGKPGLKAVPPPLDHLGFKLRPEWREKLFAGRVSPKVRPWLPARMPAFASRAGMLAAGFSHAVGLPAASTARSPLDAAAAKVGAAMVSANGGLACVTCHGIGAKPPIAVFEGEGPNFALSAKRLNRAYFHRWMNDPPRLWPGTIMPKYAVDGKTPLTQHYDGDAARQFDAIFEYLRTIPDN